MGEEKIIVLSQKDRKELVRLTDRAKTTPMILLFGKYDISRDARDRVRDKWIELGTKYGFVPASVRGVNRVTGEVML